MPCLLKLPKKNSPGIVTFNTGELFSSLFKKKKIQKFINNKNDWVFGINLSGSYERLQNFPNPDWLSFILCYSKNSSYLKNIPEKKKIDICYVNFQKEFKISDKNKYWDLCIVSRDAEIKRIKYTVSIIKKLIQKNLKLKILIIVPDERSNFKRLCKNFFKESFFNLIPQILSSDELKNLDFISCDVNTFGNHPLSENTLINMISDSKFLMLNSKSEGINRAVIEALCNGTKVIVNSDLESELIPLYLNDNNTVFINEDQKMSVNKILDSLKNYSSTNAHDLIDREKFLEKFSKSKLINYFNQLFSSKSLNMDGKWYLSDLNQRLCNHGNRGNYSIKFSEKLFFEWFDIIKNLNENFIDEDHMYEKRFEDKPDFTNANILRFKKFNFILKNKIKKLLK